MAKYLIDANLPYDLLKDCGVDFIHMRDLNDASTDTQMWKYARARNLTIITKDTNFSDKILLNQPPPHVIHIRFGNMKLKTFIHHFLVSWVDIQELSRHYKLVRVYLDRLEAIR